jgi:hypothetical protein
MRRRAYALLTIAVIVLQEGAASSSTDDRTPLSSRIEAITALANASYDEWLGGPAPAAAALDPAALDRRGSMAVEAHVAYRLARHRFSHVETADLADGVAWYLQSRVVEQSFNRRYRSPGYRHQTACFFGCEVVVSLPALTLSRWADGAGRPEFLRASSSRDWPPLYRSVALDARAFGVSLALASLERELGWPSLQGALRVVAQGSDRSGVVSILEAATGRRLDAVFRGVTDTTDFLIRSVSESVTTTCAPPACHRSEVAIGGRGAVPFPLTVRLDFADGTSATAAWAGSDEALIFESPAPLTRIRLDPDRHWLLDTDYSNNEHLETRSTNVPVTKWLARWLVWLQDATLTYTFFV